MYNVILSFDSAKIFLFLLFKRLVIVETHNILEKAQIRKLNLIHSIRL